MRGRLGRFFSFLLFNWVDVFLLFIEREKIKRVNLGMGIGNDLVWDLR